MIGWINDGFIIVAIFIDSFAVVTEFVFAVVIVEYRLLSSHLFILNNLQVSCIS